LAEKNLEGDYQIWTIVAFLSMCSIIVFSATGKLAILSGQGFSFLVKHTAIVVASLGAMWYFHKFDYHKFATVSNFVCFFR
jgi:cell division protein FtsW